MHAHGNEIIRQFSLRTHRRGSCLYYRNMQKKLPAGAVVITRLFILAAQVGLDVRKKKGAHRTPRDADRCWTCLIVRAPSGGCARREHYTHMQKKQLRPLCIAFRPLFFFGLKLMYTRSQPLTYTKCGCALKRAKTGGHTQNTLLRSTAAALRFADIISMPIFCSRKTNAR